jgi:hypothetical protein
MLDDAGFSDVVIEAYPADRPATADDGTVAFVARKQLTGIRPITPLSDRATAKRLSPGARR